MLLVPELDFEVASGTLGGCFTTVEGLLVQARDQLASSHQLYTGDSATQGDRAKLAEFVDRMNKVSCVERKMSE
jgi:zinc finger protein